MTHHSRDFWTPERRRELIELKDAGKSNTFLAEHYDCTVKAIKQAIYRTRKASGAPMRKYWQPCGSRRTAFKAARHATAVSTAKITRETRPLPDSITAWLCGDPLPGRSALDRKRSGANDDGQAAGRGSKITLAMEPMRCP